MIFVVLALILLAAPFNALMDWSAEGKFRKDFWNKNRGWELKYKRIRDKNRGYKFVPYEKKWYHFGFAPHYEERFPFSTTIFVFLTDGWHLLQYLFHSSWQLAIAIPLTLMLQIDMIWSLVVWKVIKLLFSLNFELIYRTKK